MIRLMTEQECYDELLARFQKAIDDAQELMDDALLAGDTSTVLFAECAIKQFERQRKGLRKPGEPRR